MGIFDIQVSSFKRANVTTDPRPVKLGVWLTSDKYAQKVKTCHTITDKKERDKFKAENLPVITVSGTFTYRNEENFVSHSGFICIDIDAKDNPDINDLNALKKIIAENTPVAYCGLSVSGAGVYCLFRVPQNIDPEKHQRLYYGIKQAIEKAGIICDNKTALSKVSACRFYSYDPEAYFNENAPIVEKYAKEEPTEPQKVGGVRSSPKKRESINKRSNQKDPFLFCIETIEQNRVDITKDFETWLMLGYSIASKYGTGGEDFYHRISRFYPNYSSKETQQMYKKCLNSKNVSIGYFFAVCKDYNITFKREEEAPRSDPETIDPIQAPYGLNPFTGEIFDSRGYPSDWDIEPPKSGTSEYFKMIREELNRSEEPRPDLLAKIDPMASKIIRTFDAVL